MIVNTNIIITIINIIKIIITYSLSNYYCLQLATYLRNVQLARGRHLKIKYWKTRLEITRNKYKL